MIILFLSLNQFLQKHKKNYLKATIRITNYVNQLLSLPLLKYTHINTHAGTHTHTHTNINNNNNNNNNNIIIIIIIIIIVIIKKEIPTSLSKE